MSTTADTGNSATAVLSSTGLVGAGVREIGGVDQDGEKIDDTLITSTTVKTYIPGDLYEPGSALARATLAGTGFVMSRSLPTLKNNEIMVSKYVFQFNGKTGPTHTAEA